MHTTIRSMIKEVLILVVVISGVLGIPPPRPEEYDFLNQDYDLPSPIQKRASFKERYVLHNGAVVRTRPGSAYVLVSATHGCSDNALEKAAHGISLMVRHMPTEVFNGVSRSHGLGIFTKAETMAAYPENYHLADTAQCKGKCSGSCAHTCTFDGRKFSSIAGLTNSRAVVLDDVVLCDSRDPYHHQDNILVHEFGHLVMGYMPSQWRNKINAAYTHEKYARLWKPNVYATANSAEYWAEATEAFFFATTRTDVTGGTNMCGTSHVCSNEAQTRAYLKHHDPQLFEVLSYAYTNSHPEIAGNIGVCI
ncbi:hypothetical protein LOTGIDRAFT_235629 [Lottia gigantea]|uniref:Peptidase M12B domain-containing protein n=1 Tax=Lottia gigantea TaxID=225164 RepID=V3ZTZ6_LOTGI|nr:hypothetical protein LOTGIDRAFT_235629 [Lottia gigantea]ESO86050.1 hypothetical protein LOTGIDRAFT_235629 [Lottia gigantea]